MLSRGMAFLETALMESSVTATYTRGVSEYEVQAVQAGVSWNAIERSNGGALESSARDFIVKQADLGLDPQQRDRLTIGTTTWTVFNQIDNECWRKVGDTGLIRIHCRR